MIVQKSHSSFSFFDIDKTGFWKRNYMNISRNKTI